MQHPGLLEHPDFSLRLVGASTGASVDIARSDKIWAVIDRSSFKVGATQLPANAQALKLELVGRLAAHLSQAFVHQRQESAPASNESRYGA